MIDESRTLEIFGYTSDELSPYSNKRIVTVCEGCGRYRTPPKYGYTDLCLSCAKSGSKNPNYGKAPSENTKVKQRKAMTGKYLTEETKIKIGNANRGDKNGNYGKPLSQKTKNIISKIFKDKKLSIDQRRKISAAHQGVKLEDWKEFTKEKLYCEKFDDACRERNREKYGNQCFICGKAKEENGNRRLSVHHIDKNRQQGCNTVDWSLVPLCAEHHGSCHNDLWESRINYLLAHVWVSI